VVPVAEVPVEDVEETLALPLVLVVDDEPTVADTLTLILLRAGFAARGVYSAKAALEVARDAEPAFLLSDVYMPGMSGIELAMALSAEFPKCKVLLFSGHAAAADLVEARAAGYDFPLLAKPVHPAEIVRYISKCLRGGESAAAEGDHSRAQVIGLPSSGLLAS
jgi:FixJ family two-component response regulator